LTGMELRENEPLARHTTLRTGGPARYFIEAATIADLHDAVQFARDRRLPVAILGGGSNLLAADAGFAGAVIHVANRGFKLIETAPGNAVVEAEAGEEWDAFVSATVAGGWQGLENLSFIPGTVGGAVAGNIGAYGVEVRELVRWVEAIDLRNNQIRRFTAEECAFTYRNSFFKTTEGRHYLVTRAAFGLKKPGSVNTTYRDVAEYLAARKIDNPTPQQLREAVVAIRKAKLPDVATVATAGSFFKNPIIPRPQYDALAARFPGLPGHPEPDGAVKVPLGWILDKICGLKGHRIGRVGTHDRQALVIINNGGTAAEIEEFASLIARAVFDKTGIAIEWEVEKLGPVQRPSASS